MVDQEPTKKFKKKKMPKAKAKALIPVLRQFNKMAKHMIAVLSKQVEYKEKKLHTISLLIQDLKIPDSQTTISVQALDMSQTKFTKRGEGAENKLMQWEKDFKNKKKGLLL